jgi:hypothetical protein
MCAQTYEKKPLFDFMRERIKDMGKMFGREEPQAFAQWFINMYYLAPTDVFISDGSKDGKVDAFFKTDDGISVLHHVINSKFTREYDKLAPRSFYDEIIAFWRAFDDKNTRPKYLENAVKAELRPRYWKLFERYDAGSADLMFLTNCRRSDNQYLQVEDLPVKVFHLDDLIQHMVDDIDICMPRTHSMILTGISHVLSPDMKDTEVPTSIVFARVVDFIKYMKDDPYDLLFARNVRLDLGREKPTNKAIHDTFSGNPKEFAFSNNGITLLCEKHTHASGTKELTLENPRVVNGSQTLHSVRDVPNPSTNARVMVRIIEIPPLRGSDLSEQIAKKKGVINKISIRSNQQNPIETWNLVANDDFQLSLYRYFRRKNLFYERRAKEWDYRSRQLKSVEINRGPAIKALTQLIASYKWDDKKLGPVTAKKGVGELFNGKAYEHIRTTPPELAFQIWLAADIVDYSFKLLAQGSRYIDSLTGHSKQALFALVAKTLTSAGANWESPGFTALLEQQWTEWTQKLENRWKKLTKASIKHIYHHYRKAAKLHREREGYELTLNNYFKTPSGVGSIFAKPTPKVLRTLARNVLN